MKTALRDWFLIYLGLTLLVYQIYAFTCWQWSPVQWPPIVRFFFAATWVTVTIRVIICYEDEINS